MYLLFTGDTTGTSARGSIILSKAPADLTEDALKPSSGKKSASAARSRCKKAPASNRPLIVIKRARLDQVDE